MDEEQWMAYRRRLRERAARQFFLFLGPLMIVMAFVAFFGPMHQIAGDFRDDPAFRIVMSGAMIAFGTLTLIASVRWLANDRRK